jgi:hypothetical protein
MLNLTSKGIITRDQLIKFMQNEDNAELIKQVDDFFIKRIADKDIEGMLCFIEAISIIIGIAGRELKEFQVLLHGGRYSGNA